MHKEKVSKEGCDIESSQTGTHYYLVEHRIVVFFARQYLALLSDISFTFAKKKKKKKKRVC